MADENNEGFVMERIFDAPRDKVWEAWTDPESIKKWWGPKDFTAPSVEIDFREGGKYLYCMRGPAGTQFDKDMYSAGVFKEIIPQEKIVVSDYFSDEHGNKADPTAMGLPADMPVEMEIAVHFADAGEGKTKLRIVYPKPTSEAALEAMKKSGMEEGWSTTLDKLAAIL